MKRREFFTRTLGAIAVAVGWKPPLVSWVLTGDRFWSDPRFMSDYPTWLGREEISLCPKWDPAMLSGAGGTALHDEGTFVCTNSRTPCREEPTDD